MKSPQSTLLTIFTLPLTFILSLTIAHAEPIKVAVVDINALMSQFHESITAQKNDQDKRKKYNTQDQEKVAALLALETEINKLRQQVRDPAIGENKRKEIEAAGTEKMQTLQLLQKSRQEATQVALKELQDNMIAVSQDIRAKVLKAVNDYVKAENYDYLFDSTGQSTNYVPFVLYIKNKTDITAAVLKELNKNAPQTEEEE